MGKRALIRDPTTVATLVSHSQAVDRGHRVALRRSPSLGGTALAGAVVLVSIWAGDWIAGLAVAVLWASWRYLPQEGPPVLALPLTLQWTEVTCGIFYAAATGRRLGPMLLSDYRPMVLIGLGSITAIGLGLFVGARLVRGPARAGMLPPAFSSLALGQLYLLFLMSAGIGERLAWSIPQLTQPIMVLTYCRFALLFLVLRRLSQPRFRWGWIAAVACTELLLGFTSYFAAFREPMMIAALSFFERFDRARATHWVVLGVLGVTAFLTSLLWLSIRPAYRGAFLTPGFAESRLTRLERFGSLASQWLMRSPDTFLYDTDALVTRLWLVYYPALAVKRVPSVLPHEDGALLWGAVRHILTPRLLFPDKPVLPSDSEEVRRYSGVWVAGEESDTSIAFGYTAESYVDFGLPWMFLPICVYGVLMGIAYQMLLRTIRHRDLASALVAVVYWMCLNQFGRSWIKLLGLSGTLLIYLGGAAILLDRYLLIPRHHHRRRSA